MTERDAPLAMSAAEFRTIGHALVDSVASFLEAMPERRVASAITADRVRSLLRSDRELPMEGEDAAELIESASKLLFDHSLFNGHPRFFGYITSAPAPIGMLGDLLAAAVNANVGAWRLAPVATEIEAQAVRWIADLIGFPRNGGGIFVSGGNMANIVALLAARRAAAKWDVRTKGMQDGTSPRMRVYASAETHTWLQKATDIAGLGTDAIRWIPTDTTLRMDTDALRTALEHDLAAGELPLMVVGTAGTVSTGAVDPLREIAAICRRAGIWFHIDGAYGALAAAVPGMPADLQALGLADSVAVDPHKWLYSPLEAGCVLVRDASALHDAFAYHPPYYHFGQHATNYSEHGPQNSRGFRALKVWLALRQAGRAGYERMIGDDVRLSRRLFDLASAHAELEACTQELSITTFRYVPVDLRDDLGHDDDDAADPAVERYLDALNEALLERIQLSGRAFVSHAVVRGQFLLRACIVNFHTRASDIDALPTIVAALGRDIDASLRSSLPRARVRMSAGA